MTVASLEAAAGGNSVLGPGAVDAIHLADGDDVARPEPAFIYGRHTPDDLAGYRNETWIWPVKVYVARNIDVIGPWYSPGILLVSGDVYLNCDELYLDRGTPVAMRKVASHRLGVARGEQRVRRVSGQSMLLATGGHQIYGHWPADFLPKLFAMKAAGFDPDKLKILLPTNMGAFGRAFLDLLGMPSDNIVSYDPDREIISAEELIVPTLLRLSGRASPMLTESVAYLNDRIDRFNPGLRASALPRVFLSRQKSGRVGRPMINVDRIEAMAAVAGFSIVYPEQLSLPDQVALFRGARQIVGQYGSALHGTMFGTPGAMVCALQGTGPACAGYLQSGIAERIGQSVGYVYGASVDWPPPDTPFIIEEEAFATCLREQFS